MKSFRFTMMSLFVSVGIMGLTASCNNTGKNAQEGVTDSLANSLDAFNEQVHNFDSSWKDRVKMLNTRITEWDSSTKTYRGSLGDRMENQLGKIKQQRDSLEKTLQTAGDKTKENWNDFQRSVSNQYSDIVEAMRNLGKLNQ